MEASVVLVNMELHGPSGSMELLMCIHDCVILV